MFDYTKEELSDVINIFFESKNPLILKSFPAKEKKKYLTLIVISALFKQGIVYSEQDINHILKSVFHDFVTLRRYLVDYQFLTRDTDGSRYIKK